MSGPFGWFSITLCNEKVRDLRTRMEELEGEKRSLEAGRERLELPAIDKEMLKSLLDNFEKVMAEGPNPKKKHLLHQLVKKVLIHSRQTIEIWYMLLNTQRFADCNIWVPKCNSIRSLPGYNEPEVYFRIVHLAQEGHKGAPVAAYREQTVEIALGPKGAFENGNIGALTRRLAVDRVVRAMPLNRGNPKPPKESKTPRVVELLRKAIEWRGLLESGEITNQADIARREGITRARMTQVMGMLRLAPEIQVMILSPPGTLHRRPVTERMLRPIGSITNQRDQLREFHRFLL